MCFEVYRLAGMDERGREVCSPRVHTVCAQLLLFPIRSSLWLESQYDLNWVGIAMASDRNIRLGCRLRLVPVEAGCTCGLQRHRFFSLSNQFPDSFP